MNVPRWLSVFVTQSIGTKHSGRRAHNALQIVYRSLHSYHKNLHLESESAWRRTMTESLFSQWYKNSDLDYGDFWLYKITRLLGRINCTTPRGIPCKGRQKDRMRLCQEAELLCDTILSQLHRAGGFTSAADATYVRKFILSFPLWYTHQLSAITAHMLTDWAINRMPDVTSSVRDKLVRVVLRVLCAYGNRIDWRPPCHQNSVLTASSMRIYTDTNIPTHICHFFTYFFETPCEKLVSIFDAYLNAKNITGVYRYQIWDVLKSLLFWMSKDCNRPLNESLDRIDGVSIQNWLTEISCRCAESVLRRYRNSLKHIIRANILGAPLECACIGNTRGQLRERAQRLTYSEDDFQKLRAACQTHMDRLLLALLSQTGLRNSAVRNLTVSRFTGDYGTALEKGRKWHTFPISESLKNYRDVYLQKEHKTGSPFVFPDVRDPAHCMTTSQIRSWLKNMATRADVHGPHVTIHSFRRYVVTTLLLHGNNMHQVMKYVGHTHPSTTVGYWCSQPDQLVKMMKLPWCKEDTPTTYTAAELMHKRACELLAVQSKQ